MGGGTVSRLDNTSAVLECALDLSQTLTHSKTVTKKAEDIHHSPGHLRDSLGEFRASGVLINGDGKNLLDGLQKYMMDEESTPLRFSQFPGVPPFLNYIVGPGDIPVHPPPILRSVIEQLPPILCLVKQAIFAE